MHSIIRRVKHIHRCTRTNLLSCQLSSAVQHQLFRLPQSHSLHLHHSLLATSCPSINTSSLSAAVAGIYWSQTPISNFLPNQLQYYSNQLPSLTSSFQYYHHYCHRDHHIFCDLWYNNTLYSLTARLSCFSTSKYRWKPVFQYYIQQQLLIIKVNKETVTLTKWESLYNEISLIRNNFKIWIWCKWHRVGLSYFDTMQVIDV